MAPDLPTDNCARWLAINKRSRNPNAPQSHSAASLTFGYASSGITTTFGMERLVSIIRCGTPDLTGTKSAIAEKRKAYFTLNYHLSTFLLQRQPSVAGIG